jgi:hypothetical protein
MALKAEGTAAYVIANPDLGALADSGMRSQWDTDVMSIFADQSLVYPVYKETNGSTISDIASFVAAHPKRRIGVLLETSRILPVDLKSALAGTDHIVFLLPDANPVAYVAALTPGRTVDISDNFKPKLRNKDYSGDDWLGNNHTTWKAAMRPGFSDYTILPSAFKVGGGPVGAIAIHLTYEDGTNTRVQHFVSATSDQNMPQAVKFTEALGDLQAQVAVTPNRFRNSPGMALYVAQSTSGSFTNLSGNIRQQVSHHIYTIAKYLGV